MSYTSPGGKSGTGTRSFEPDEKGNYTFVANGTRDGLTCQEQVSKAACPPPQLACSVSISSSEVGRREDFTVNVSATPGDRAESVKLEATCEGETLVSDTLSSPFSWTGSLKKSGVCTFTAVADGARARTSDACSATVEVLAPESRWITRLYPAWGTGDDERSFDPAAAMGNGPDRHRLQADLGKGLGLSLEYMPLPWLGWELGYLYLEGEAHYVFDTEFVWGHG